MKDIKAILAAINMSDDERETAIHEVNENYRTIEEVQKKTNRISELEKQNEALTEQVGNLEGDSEELEKLRKQVQDFADAEEQRKADELEKAKRDSFRTFFNAAIGNKEFANDIVRDSVFERVYEKCSSETGISAESVINELTKDVDGVWKNPQQEFNKMPDPARISTRKINGEEAAKQEIKDFLFRKKE